LRERGIFATRQLAKRQLTWLRAMPDVALFDCLSPGVEASVRARIETELG
jgi:tRNA dimethylallyltransferase